MKECRYYNKMDGNRVECVLCPHRCVIAVGRHGRCGSRRNAGGTLVSDAYGRPCSVAIDPIEKKPLVGFHPGTWCLSIACTGCNLRCLNCQNYEISQVLPDDVQHASLMPDDVVKLALRYNIPGIAYTYTEPLTYIEYVTDTARIAHEHGLWNILVTAGYVNPEPLAVLLPFIDAANVDIKSMSDELYMHLNGCHLQPVLDSVLTMHKAGVWLELTNLLIPSYNDSPNLIRALCHWIVNNGLAEQPLHFSRFFPRYKLSSLPPTPVSILRMAKKIAEAEGITHVHLGNI